MDKLKRNILVFITALTLTFGLSIVENSITVHAASKALTATKARVSHLNWSLHNNYLGLKNQGQWQEYIKGIRLTIIDIPGSEKKEKDALISSVNKAEALVNGLSRINQVEKSMESNTPRYGNVRQWNNYLTLSKQDLDKVDKVEFSKEIEKLTTRLNICEEKVNSITEEYNVKFDKVKELYNKAEKSKDVDEGKKALLEAEKLSKCEESDRLVYKCKLLLADLSEITLTKDEISLRSAYYVLEEILDFGGFDVMNTEPSTIEDTIKHEVGNGVEVKATRVLVNPDKNEEVFDIVLYKGEAKLYPISIVFN